MTVTIPAPNAKQLMFFRDRHKYVAYGGARGGGKSWAVRTNALLMAARYPGITQVIIRRSYPELYANHIKPFLKLLPKGCYTYNDTKKELTLPNTSRIIFRFCACDKDLLNFQGTEYDLMYIDEATQFTEEQFRILAACVRGTGDGFPKRCYLTCNPGGIGHAWVKRLFVDRQYNEGENADEYSFIQAGVRDNKALMKSQPDYIRQLEALPPKLREAWLDGAWDIQSGQFFEDFHDRPEHYEDRQFTHVIEPFEIPPDWKIYRSFDWGYHRPFSCGWWAVDYDGVVYRILEMYGCTETPNEGVRWTPDKVFSEIAKTEREHRWLRGKHISGVADPAIWDGETGESIAQCAARHGVYFVKGDHARIPGWMQLHYRLAFDENGFPQMYVFKNCRAFIRTLPLLQYNAQMGEDLDSDGEDHIADETRYFLMSRPIKPRLTAKTKGGMKLLLDIDGDSLKAAPKRRMEIIG
ncbi:MAG: phage terminase large subunit [Eubacteriales bacterium]|nr:phage terminase large subunit [Eubacteriales bacterium]